MVKVTVLMPTYNVAPYVKEAIESVLQQTYRDFELLVIDDCSTDNTVAIVRQINDPRIRVVQNERNLGLAENLNRGLSLISTEYVSRMDGDDIAEPQWLEREVSILDSHPDIGICGGGFERFGSCKSLVRFPEHHEDCLTNMLFECSIIVPTFRMSLYRDRGLRYRTDAFPAEDYQFWAECLRIAKAHNIQETLFPLPHASIANMHSSTTGTGTQGGRGEALHAGMVEHGFHHGREKLLHWSIHGK